MVPITPRTKANVNLFTGLGYSPILTEPGGNVYGKAKDNRVWLGLVRHTRDGKQHRRIGHVTAAVYETNRTKTDHFFRKYQGWAISKFLLASATELGFRYVRFNFQDSQGYISVEKAKQAGKDIPREGGFEEQRLFDPKELRADCVLLGADVHAVADELRGTTGDLEHALLEIVGVPFEDVSLDSLGELDQLVFQCDSCAWWCDIGEMAEHAEGVCDDCAPDIGGR